MERTDPVLLPPEELFSAVEELLEQGLDAEFTVTGNSMWPLLKSGRDTVTLRALDSPLKKGDLILFSPVKGRYLLHRVTRLEKNAFESTGDANLSSDGVFPTTCILGRVILIHRKEKRISCKNFWYRFSVWVWMGLVPVRKPLLKILRFFARLRRIGASNEPKKGK